MRTQTLAVDAPEVKMLEIPVIFTGVLDETWKVIPLWPLFGVKGGEVVTVPCPIRDKAENNNTAKSSVFLIAVNKVKH